jgi:uridine phosphorylase
VIPAPPMSEDLAIINPAPPKGGAPLPPFVVMAGSLPDLAAICGSLGVDKTGFRSFLTSRLYTEAEQKFALAGPLIGAPYAVMLMETLIAWGAQTLVFFGWCGAISPEVHIGDIIVPTGALIDEGTSLHYRMKTGGMATPGNRITTAITQEMAEKAIPHHTGVIWTTDGFFRETPERVRHFQQQNALAVEMELSALFTVGNFRKIDVGAILVVSDSLSDLSWRQGFKDKRFKTQRGAVCEVIHQLCRTQQIP